MATSLERRMLPTLGHIITGPFVGLIAVKGVNAVRAIDARLYESTGNLYRAPDRYDVELPETQIVLQDAEFMMVPDKRNANCIGSPAPFVGYVKGTEVISSVSRDLPNWVQIRRRLPRYCGEAPAFVTIYGEQPVYKAKFAMLCVRKDEDGRFLTWADGVQAAVIA